MSCSYCLIRTVLVAVVLSVNLAPLKAQKASIQWFERVIKTDSLQLKDIIRQASSFIPVKGNTINHGITSETCWIVSQPLQVSTPTYLWINNPVLGELDFYAVAGDSVIQTTKTGFLRNYTSREILVNGFSFAIPEDRTVRIVLKIKSQEAMAIPLRIEPLLVLENELFNNQTIVFVVLGVVIALFLLYSVIFLFLREKDYLYYLIYAGCSLLVITKVEGIAFSWFWRDQPWLNNYSAIFDSLTTMAGGIFSYHFIRIRKHYPVLSYLFLACIGLQAVGLVGSLAGHNRIALSIASGVSPFFMVFSIVGGVLVLVKKKYRPAKYYLIGWPILYIGATIYIMKSFGAITSDNLLIVHSLEIAIALEMLVLAVGVSRSIEQLRIEKELAQQENIAITERQNEKLELLVVERTHTLEAQNEELRQQQEELTSQREVIFKQNLVIQHHNEDLELKIQKQTEELKRTNNELAEHNSQLEQFAYVTAHNLRAPVARLLGLANLLELKQQLFEDEETRSIFEKLVASSQNLDSIIHDLNKILELRRDFNIEFSEVSLAELLARVKESLTNEIQFSGCSLQSDFSEIEKLSSFKPYLESILFNLVSNAIKYRHPGRPLVVKVSAHVLDESIMLRVADNGLGIDLKKHENKIFGLYKRFHSHVEGKGMGLFLVKTQVNVLKGEIELQSEEGNGLTVSVFFPRG